MTVYVNGRARWVGIKPKKLELDQFVHPGKNIVSVCYENAFHTKVHPAEGPLQKHSGLYKPVKIIWEEEGKEKTYIIKDWKVQDGVGGKRKGYADPKFDDANWLTIPDVEKLVTVPEVGNLLWMRRSFQYHKTDGWEAPVYLELQKAAARCYIYVNGFFLARYEDDGPQRKFYIPDDLLEEENVVSLMIEGPGIHPNVDNRFEPIIFSGPTLGRYFTAKQCDCNLLEK